MPNTLEKSEKYLSLFLELYKKDSLTADIDTKAVQFDMTDAKIVKILEMQTQGLGDYLRDQGYPTAAVNAVWRPYTLTQDRGIRFTLDRADSDETLGLQIGKVADDFSCMYMKPELDSYRFAKFSTSPKVTGALTESNIMDAIDTAAVYMNDKEIADSGRILFVNQNLELAMRKALPRQWGNEGEINTKVLKYNGLEVRFVPSNRFNTQVTLNPGTANSFGYEPGGDPINFILIDPKAIWQVTRFANAKFVTADENQIMDSHLFMFRIVHDCGLIIGKENGVYSHVNS
jgi:hypothetical protein